jgi:hypothetical protein
VKASGESWCESILRLGQFLSTELIWVNSFLPEPDDLANERKSQKETASETLDRCHGNVDIRDLLVLGSGYI